MADERRRQLERRAGAGDPQAASALLLERLRLGEVTAEGLRLAAFLGDAAAQEALPDAVSGDPGDLESWLEGLRRQGADLLVRAALLAGRHVLGRFAEVLTHDPRPAAALEAVEAWLSCPCEAHRVAARLAAEDADEAAREAAVVPEGSDEAAFAAWAARDAALSAAALRPEEALQQAAAAVLEAGSALEDDAAVREAVRRALLERALGAADGS